MQSVRGGLFNRGPLRKLACLIIITGTFTGSEGRAQPAADHRLNPIVHAPSTRYQSRVSRLDDTSQNSTANPTVRALAGWLERNAEAARATHVESQSTTAAAKVQEVALDRLRRRAAGDLEVQFRPGKNTPMFVKGALQPRVQAPAGRPLSEQDLDVLTAREFLRVYRELLRIDDPDLEFTVSDYTKDSLNRRHVRFKQKHRDLEVWPCELAVHLNPQGAVDLMNGTFIPTPGNVGAQPHLTGDEAVLRATEEVAGIGYAQAGKPELIIYGPLDGSARLAWKFDTEGRAEHSRRVVVDAQTGKVLVHYSRVHQAAATGSGADGTGTSRTLNLWQQGNTFYMVDTSKKMFDAASTPPNNARGAILVYDGANKEVQDPAFSAGLAQSTSANTGWEPDAVGAAYGLSQTFDYYQDRFSRNSLNGQGGNIRAIVRYGDNVFNAFWYSATKTMVFGFGFTRLVDISGHELTHGVIDSVGNGGILEYVNQSGALNEALADTFGEMVEAFSIGANPDWLKADPFEPTNRAKLIQDYANPNSATQGGMPNPAKMSQFVRLSVNQDNGGVHINSSIINHCFYQLAVGMNGAIGMRDAEQIFYRAMTMFLQKQSQFIDMRLACVTSASEIFGPDSTQHRKTKEAFDFVEIFEAPSTPAPPPIPTVNGPDSTLFLRLEPFFVGGFVMGRREQAIGDPVDGTLLNTQRLPGIHKMSVSGDGSFGVFITFDNDVGLFATDGSFLDFAGLSGNVHSVVISPDASKFAAVLVDQAAGQPANGITLVDISKNTEEDIPLFAPTKDGGFLDIIQYADAMDFLADSQTLVYDALSVIRSSTGQHFEGWTLFALDLQTKNIVTLIDLNEGLDFGNPSLGNTRNHLITYEVIEKANGRSSIFAADLYSGEVALVGRMANANSIGLPSYSGDDTAIIYSQDDPNSVSAFSLLRQGVGNDGITPAGNPQLWLADADFGVVYRRGNFVAQNQPPTVQITSPSAAQVFTAPAEFDVVVSASDPDGSVALVEFFIGSEKVAEDNTPPYVIGIQNAPEGTMRLTARAIDNLGAAADSASIEVNIRAAGGAPLAIILQPENQTVVAGANAAFAVEVAGGTGNYTFKWQRNGVDLDVTSARLELQNVVVGAAGDYTVVVSDGVTTMTSNVARLAVTGGAAANQPPVLEAIPNQTVSQGATLTFTSKATDPDAPPQTLTFSLEPGAPAGATINPQTGVFTWTPAAAQNPGTFVVMIKVSDNGQPPLNDSESVRITVVTGKVIELSGRFVGPLLELTISGGANNDIFRVEASVDLTTWAPVATLVKTDATVRFIDPESTGLNRRYYRVAVLPD